MYELFPMFMCFASYNNDFFPTSIFRDSVFLRGPIERIFKRKVNFMERLVDAQFLLWISSKKNELDFELLNEFNKNFSQDNSIIDKCFLNNVRKEVILKEIDTMKGGVKNFYYKQSLSWNVNKIYFDIMKMNKIERKTNLQSILRSLMGTLGLPNFLLDNLIDLISKTLNTRRIGLKTIASFLKNNVENLTVSDLFFYIITGNPNASTLTPKALLTVITGYVSNKNEFKSIMENEKSFSNFIDYIIVRFLIIYDPELRGRVERRRIKAEQIESDLDEIACIEDFEAVYDMYSELKPAKEDFLKPEDLCRYDDRRISSFIINRFARYMKKGNTSKGFAFKDFVFFVSFLEDKSSAASLNFWFKICDLDDDGVLSFTEIEELYSQQKKHAKSFYEIKNDKLRDDKPLTYSNAVSTYKPEKFKNVLPQIIDMLGPKKEYKLSDIRNSKCWGQFFSILVDGLVDDWRYRDPMYEWMNGILPSVSSQWKRFISKSKYLKEKEAKRMTELKLYE